MNVTAKLLGAFFALSTFAIAPTWAADIDGENPTPESVAAWINIPGGIVDTEGKIAYLSSATDGCEAIDMTNGRPVWEKKEAYRPWALDGDRLIVKAPRGEATPNTLNIAVLNAADGEVRMNCPAIVFPEWISVDSGLGLAFTSRAEIESNSLVLYWHASRHHAGTEKATPEMIAEARKEASGQVQVDLELGMSDLKEDDVPQALKQARPPKFIDVGSKRLTMTESSEKIPGGIHCIRRTLHAADLATGRPLWQREIASEVYVPIPAAASRSPAVPPSAPRRR